MALGIGSVCWSGPSIHFGGQTRLGGLRPPAAEDPAFVDARPLPQPSSSRTRIAQHRTGAHDVARLRRSALVTRPRAQKTSTIRGS
jgi:hypothetical protein